MSHSLEEMMVKTMEPIDAEAASIACLPVEIVTKVLEYLSATDQMRSKQVCRMWHHVLTDLDEYWRQRCARDFSETFEHAHSKCQPPLTWRQLYHSLHLWTKLDVAKETWTKILDTGNIISINVVSLYKDTLVLRAFDYKCFSHVYYLDKYTRETKKRVVLYKEPFYDNDDYLHIEASSSILKIHKVNYGNSQPYSSTAQPDTTVDNVHDYVIIGRDVYYTVCNEIDVNKIFVRKRSDNYNSFTEFITAPLPIKGISYYNGHLHVLVENNIVFKIVENQLVHIKHESNVFMPLLRYGFQLIDHSELDCYSYLEPSRFTHPHRTNVNYHYNNLTFDLDVDYGVLSIFINAVADPVKVYYLSNVLPGLRDFTGIDVLEKENGHTVYVATKSIILALDLDH